MGNETLADDVFQETFIRFYESAKSDREMTNVSAFIFRIARNLCLNEKQRKHNSFLTFEELIFKTSDSSYENKEKMALLESALEMLPDKYREVFVLREFLGLSYSEIAMTIESTLPTVRIRIYRAKQKIREILKPYIDDMKETK
jgi:RNA polymerase sigma-70 factor (ECF subfamily)